MEELLSIDVFEVDPIANNDDLQLVVNYLRDEGYQTNDRALKGMCEAERYLQQAYAGRYLFELIQNVRDANRQAGMDGSVFIKLDADTLTIANTGSPFTKKGIRSITTIGDSELYKASCKQVFIQGVSKIGDQC